MKSTLSAAMLALCAGAAYAQPVIDGQLGSDAYGPLLWAQNQPTTFGNNTAGTIGTVGDPANVVKGVELVIPMATLGNPTSIKIAGLINGGGHDYASNQFIGSLPTNTGNPGEPRNINLANIAGDQFVTLDLTRSGTAPIVDGTRDTSLYGAPRFLQNNYTGFGNNSQTTGTTANGSEIDALYAVVYDNGTAADTTDDLLYVFVAGNLETNFNKLDLFFDTAAGGQSPLRNDNAAIDFNGLNRMGGNGTQPGLTFDTGFAADHFIGVTNGGSPTALYINYAQLLTDPGAGPGFYCGTAAPLSNGVLTGGDAGAPALQCSIDNSNTIGVGGGVTGITLPHPDVASGSEIDGLYGTVVGNKLYLLVTGNLETNYNKLDLFIDVNATEGQNVLRMDNVDIDYNGLNRMGTGGGGDTARPGMKFDAGFAPDYFIGVTNGSYPVENYTNAALLRADGPIYTSGYIMDYSATSGGPKSTLPVMNFAATYRDEPDFVSTDPLNTDGAPRAAFNGQLIPGLIKVAINNSNVGGVHGVENNDTSGASSVTTGIELEIDLTELGWDNGPIRVAGFLNGTGHDFVSNQVLGGLPTPAAATYAPDLGESAMVDFSAVAGDQFVTIGGAPPCPGNECGPQDYNGDGDSGTDQDIEAFFACLGGTCCSTCFCQGSDFNGDGDFGTDQDIEAFFRVLGGNPC